MNLFVGKRRPFSAMVLLFALVLTLGLVLNGCSSDSETPVESKITDLIIKHKINYRAIETDVNKMILSGYDESGTMTFSPVEYPRQTTIKKSVPLSTKSIRLSYYDSSNVLLGAYVAHLNLKSGEPYIIDDPEWQDPAGQTLVKKLNLTPKTKSLLVDEVVQFYVMGTFNMGDYSFDQDLTREVVWSTGGSVIINHKGNGSFKGITPGTCVLTAEFMGVTDQADIEIPGESAFRLTPGNIAELEEGEDTYYVPLCFDYSRDIDPKYKDDTFTSYPVFFETYFGGNIGFNDGKFTVESSDDSVATFDIVRDEKSSIIAVAVRPHSPGDVLCTVTAVDFDGKEYVQKVKITTFEGVFSHFYRAKNQFPEVKENELPQGLDFRADMYGIFKSKDGKTLSSPIVVNALCETEVEEGLDRVSNVILYPGNPLDRYAYAHALIATGDSGQSSYTLKAIDGYKIYSDKLGTLDEATEAKITVNLAKPVPVEIRIAGVEDPINEPIRNGDIVNLSVGQTFGNDKAVFLMYSNDAVDNIEDSVRMEIVNEGVLEISGPSLWRALAPGQAMITYSLNENVDPMTVIIKVE